jgi:hypothetical protein
VINIIIEVKVNVTVALTMILTSNRFIEMYFLSHCAERRRLLIGHQWQDFLVRERGTRCPLGLAIQK